MVEEKQEKQVTAPCSSCLKETAHRVLFEKARQDEDRIETFGMLSCAGCGTISLGVQTRLIPDGELEYRYYPQVGTFLEIGEGALDKLSGHEDKFQTALLH
jgi:hypothetical protein